MRSWPSLFLNGIPNYIAQALHITRENPSLKIQTRVENIWVVNIVLGTAKKLLQYQPQNSVKHGISYSRVAYY